MKYVRCPHCDKELHMIDMHNWEYIWDDEFCYEIWWARCEECDKDFEVDINAKLTDIKVNIQEDER